MVPFAEYLELAAAEREGKTPFLWVKEAEERLGRLSVAPEMVALAEERLDLWDELRELAGLRVSARVRARIEAPLEERLERELAALTEEYEMKIAQLEERYPALIARRIAEALVARKGSGGLSLLRGGAAAPSASSAPPALVGAELASARAEAVTSASPSPPSLVGAELASARGPKARRIPKCPIRSLPLQPEQAKETQPWREDPQPRPSSP
jgi:pyruvate-ferredoxin/flavodoxin oxidoreductase